MVWSMLTPETSPETCHRKVDDWPIWILVGSAVNCAITGAAAVLAGGGGGGVAVVFPALGRGGAGATGEFFLWQPDTHSASEIARPIERIWNRLNMNLVS